MRIVACWQPGLVPDDEKMARALEAAGHEMVWAAEMDVVPGLLPEDQEEPAMLLAYVDFALPMEEHDRRMRSLWQMYRPLTAERPVQDARPLGMTYVERRGDFFKSLPHPYWAMAMIPVDLEFLLTAITRWEQKMATPEGREEARRYQCL